MNTGYGVNYYCTLGVPRNATAADVAAAYKDMIIRLQKGESLGISRHQLISAYHTLSDPGKRKEYDRTLPPEAPNFTITDLEFDDSFNSSRYSSEEELSLRAKVEKISVNYSTGSEQSLGTMGDPTPFSQVYGQLQKGQKVGRRLLPEPLLKKLFRQCRSADGAKLFLNDLRKEGRLLDFCLITIGISTPLLSLLLIGLYIMLI